MNVKPELKSQYEKYIVINSSDPYSKEVVDAMERVGAALDRNESPEEAEKQLKGYGLTGYMAGAAIESVVEFNPRGEEMKAFWNKQYGGTGEEAGVINPAIITINTDEKDA